MSKRQSENSGSGMDRPRLDHLQLFNEFNEGLQRAAEDLANNGDPTAEFEEQELLMSEHFEELMHHFHEYDSAVGFSLECLETALCLFGSENEVCAAWRIRLGKALLARDEMVVATHEGGDHE